MGALAENPLLISAATWIWGDEGSTTCLDSLPYFPPGCLSQLLSKGIGIGIILSSCINKAPVLRNIIQSKSVAGLSVAGSYGEVIMYSNAAFYNILKGHPFTTYGETFMVLIQTFLVVNLIWYFDSKIVAGNKVLALAVYCLYLFVVFQGMLIFNTGEEIILL